MKTAVLALIENGGKFLCISRKESPEQVGLIGGKVEDHESLESGLLREVKEEIGASVKILEKLHSETVENFLVETYLVDLVETSLVPEEGLKLFWLTKDELIAKSKWRDYNASVVKAYETYSKNSEASKGLRSST